MGDQLLLLGDQIRQHLTAAGRFPRLPLHPPRRLIKIKLRDLLQTRAQTHFERYMDEAATFTTMARFPPAFGLMGTSLGMIALLQSET